ncbi:MAG: nucleotide excision repair endonuclease [Thermoanaerobaculia bacterium]
MIREHDLVETDLGTARIDQHDDSPVFGGGPWINAEGTIAFAAALTPPDDNQTEWGSGIFTATPSLFNDGFEAATARPGRRRLTSDGGAGKARRIAPMDEAVERRIGELPDQPGIYVFLDSRRRALYVGKAKSLRKRVANYRRAEDPRTRRWWGTRSIWSTSSPGPRPRRCCSLDQEAAAALQRPAAGRQDVPLREADGSGSLAAGGFHPADRR